ncbi:MAG: carbon-nitrogen hydrolase family protein [Fusobacterium perfoetens]|uniref:carbon-nitrogen hydrolase family protein n=1 Tax=Fusobacterium perfoetens TaxID=852 RepID=UPI0023EFF757|nr:carbon-nitrogen hydrolase family protein [Fusobacterium perfoetens]MCI6151640.1 carbon-nitrogen hydrolase family protein [Fusobacterium perfoetens]MDY3237808.1 carbon-nitrogen hydrolase family protein [Fusobacterium perfoetens]
MRNLTMAIAQFESKHGDCKYNLEKAKKAIKEASEKGANLIVFPELYYQGYYTPIETFHKLAETCDGYLYNELKKEAINNNIHIIMGYCEKKEDRPGKIFNTVMFINNKGERIANYTKVYGWDTEKDIFTDGEKFEVCETELGKIGLLICYDIEFPETFRILHFKGAELVICCAAWRELLQHHWNTGLYSGAMSNLFYVAGINTVGYNPANQKLCGDSKVILPNGKLLDKASDQEELKLITLDMDEVQHEREIYPTWRDYHYDMFDKKLLEKY